MKLKRLNISKHRHSLIQRSEKVDATISWHLFASGGFLLWCICRKCPSLNYLKINTESICFLTAVFCCSFTPPIPVNLLICTSHVQPYFAVVYFWMFYFDIIDTDKIVPQMASASFLSTTTQTFMVVVGLSHSYCGAVKNSNLLLSNLPCCALLCFL